jgi:hypothetical protein
MKYILSFLLCCSALAQQTVNNFAVKTNLTMSGAQTATKVNTVSDLIALTPVQDGMMVQTLGRNTAGDGGGAVFWYSSTSVASTNLGTVFKPNSASGRFLWVGGYALDPKMFGAVGNYNSGLNTGSDDTDAFKATITDAFTKAVGIQIKTKGNYQITDTLEIPDGWAGSMDFGGGSLGGCDIYMNVTNKPFMRLLDATHFEIKNLTVYFKPQNGWGLSDALSQPQQNTNAYVFEAIGWLTFMPIQNISGFYGSGFLKNYANTNLVPSRSAGAVFNNFIETVQCRYGYIAIDLDTGSGSSWENIYILSSSGGTYNQSATSAIRVRTSLQNESFNRINVEWSKFTGKMFDLRNADIQFDSFHMEGIQPAYDGGSIKDLIYMNGGKLKFSNGHFRDLFPEWGFIVTLNIFNIAGGPMTSLLMENCKMESWNELAGYNFFRYQDTAGGANYIEVLNQDDRDIGWATNSPSWYGPSDKPQLPSVRHEIRQSFAGEPVVFTTYQFGVPTSPAYVTPTIEAGYHPGVYSIYTSTTNFHATLLQAQPTEINAGRGVVRYKANFLLPTVPSSATDDFILRIGIYSDVSSTPYSTPTDGIGLEMSYSAFGNNSLRLACRNGGVVSYSTLVSSVQANTWYDVEIIVNHDASQVRAYLSPRTTANSANVTINIPSATTVLRPIVQLVGRGTNPITARSLQLDDVSFTYAPNGN